MVIIENLHLLTYLTQGCGRFRENVPINSYVKVDPPALFSLDIMRKKSVLLSRARSL